MSATRAGQGAFIGNDGGIGLAVSLVGASSGAASTPPQAVPQEVAAKPDLEPHPDDAPAPDPMAPMIDPKDAKADDSSPAFEQAVSADHSTPGLAGGLGDGQTASGVMSEIARCLPNGVRPQLVSAVLTLAADQSGALIAAPTVTFSNPAVSKDDAHTADLIVQAVLQCGPYHDATIRGRTLALPADFTETAGLLNPIVAGTVSVSQGQRLAEPQRTVLTDALH